MNTTRVIVISDLHLGGEPPCMMSRPERLAAFIDALPGRLQPQEQLELVIAGDFIDFLAVPPLASWTADPATAQRKIEHTLHGECKPVFAALGRHVHHGHRLTIVIGNHDVELALPPAQAALLQGIGANVHQVLFVDDGRAYRVGGALIEHGNRYDGANQNDWDGVRSIASSLSRNETPIAVLEVSAGSRIVEKVVNPLKERYPFIDLLQPQGEPIALLLLAFEPSALKMDLRNLARLLRGKYLQGKTGPTRTREVAAESLSPKDAELEAVFGDAYRQLRKPDEQVGATTEWFQVFRSAQKDSLSEIIRRQEPVPPERLWQIQVVMARLLLDDRSLRPDGPTEHYGQAAERMLGGDIETVVMGHTHLARHVGPPDRATYINTGTWADLVRVPTAALDANSDGLAVLDAFLRGLLKDEGVREFHPTYADLQISPEGHVLKAQLCRAEV